MAGLQIPPNISYRYQALEPGSIRLLVVHPHNGDQDAAEAGQVACDLLPTPLSEAPSYEALSYAWGSQARDTRVAVKSQPGRVLSVTPSLYAALKRFRQKDEQRVLWIDQLCIDQENVVEREDQVGRMYDIYRHATRVIVWLGEHEGDTDLLMAMYQQLALSPVKPVRHADEMLDHMAVRALVGLGVDGDDRSKDRLNLLERFLNRPWFRRAWVYQEVVVAPKIEMIWGDLSLPFDFIVALIRNIYRITKSDRHEVWRKRLKATAGFSPLRAINHHRLVLGERKELEFLTILWHARKHLEAKDERDFVYAFLGFHHPTMRHLRGHGINGPDDHASQRPIIADYKISVRDTFKKLAHVMIWNSKSLEIFQHVVPTRGDAGVKRLPTWVPNWTGRRFTSGSPLLVPGTPHSFSACGSFLHEVDDSESSVLKVQGHVISTVKNILPYCFRQMRSGSSLKDFADLDKIQSSVEAELCGIGDTTRVTGRMNQIILRTLLVAGAFSLDKRMAHSFDDLLEAYHADDGKPPIHDTPAYQRQVYLRQALEVAAGKKVFLTLDSDIGLGYRTMAEGDLVCILHGSKMPCVLRPSSRVKGHFTLVGQCYLDGWMFGNTNPRGWPWWNSEPRLFRLL
jgi:hypothetical protein